MVEVLYRPKVWEEIHKIREEMSKEWERMTPEEWANYWKKQKKKLETEGYKEIVTLDGYKLLRKKNRPRR